MDEEIAQSRTTLHAQNAQRPKHQAIVWRNVILFAYLHVAALYGVILMFTSAKIATTIFGMVNIFHNVFNLLFIMYFFIVVIQRF